MCCCSTELLPVQLWLIALLLFVSPLVLLSQTCHLAPSGAGTPAGHFLSPLFSELILASPSLIFLHCLSPLSPPQLSPPGAASCSSDCMSPGTVPLTAGVLAGSHPSPSPVALPCAPSLAVAAWLFPSKVSAQGRGALPVLVSQLSPVPRLWLAIPGCLGSRTGSLLISLGGKRASGSELRKAEQRHWCGWECLAWLLSISVYRGCARGPG